MTQSNKELWFGSLFRIAGYGLLVISFLDIIASFFPTHLGNPNWEFALVKSLIGNFPGALIGVVLVFVSETNLRLFKLLSKACLVVTVLYLLLLPLGISSAVRINQDNQRQFVAFTNQRLLPLQQLREQLSKATTAQDLTQFLTRLNPQGPPPEITNPQATKKQLLAKLDTTENNLKTEIAAKQSDTRLNLFQQALRLNLEAIICALVFFALWRSTSRGSRR
ncbi:MAG: HpsJ family protein [Chroococcidiopsidaceae cyanobacterium CP_BM_ER_R8_30]|nr:HpsJ family protein [Chroococcidiopsidaceae cyanobacterium CP_BM_ER_R8_30]